MNNKELFSDIFYGDRVEFYRKINSTQDRIRQIHKNGPCNALVISREQLKGKGRRGNKWTSPPGGLYLSVLTHFKGNERLASIFFLLSVLKPLLKWVPEVKWKWPNDIVIDDKKAGGLLTEVLGKKWVAFGLGLNTTSSVNSFPENLRKDISIVDIDREQFLKELLKNIEKYKKFTEIPEKDFTLLNTTLYLSGKKIKTGKRTGTAAGIDRTGKLKIKTDTGIQKINAGTVRVMGRTSSHPSKILAIDIGNTSTKMGIIDESGNLRFARIATSRDKNYLNDLSGKIKKITKNINIKGVGISSVVDPLTDRVNKKLNSVLSTKTINISHLTAAGLTIDISEPDSLGADRICNAAAVNNIYKKDSIVIDMGTANTFDVISGRGTYLGGIIAPGIEAMENALVARAHRLNKVDFIPPDSEDVIGRNTKKCMQNGLYYTLTGQINAILNKINNERDKDALIIFTGGRINFLRDEFLKNYIVDNHLTLKGIFYIFQNTI
ncbi:MAG: biotin--[acetyl-CoA-carboxylase] ligase [Elusimicrobiota bacterium]